VLIGPRRAEVNALWTDGHDAAPPLLPPNAIHPDVDANVVPHDLLTSSAHAGSASATTSKVYRALTVAVRSRSKCIGIVARVALAARFCQRSQDCCQLPAMAVLLAVHVFVLYQVSSHLKLTAAVLAAAVILVVIKHVGLLGPLSALFRRGRSGHGPR